MAEMTPLTPAQLHQALRALDAGDLPDRTTLRTALHMAGTVAPLLAERAALIAGLQGLRAAHDPVWCMAVRGPHLDARQVWACSCGADQWNARIATVLREPTGGSAS